LNKPCSILLRYSNAACEVSAIHQRVSEARERLPPEIQSVVRGLLLEVLAVKGMALASDSLLKAVGSGLWEFRIGRNLKSVLKAAGIALPHNAKNRKVLVRVFCSFEDEGILLLGCYDKLRNGSDRAQNIAIQNARSLLLTFRGGK
jgi:hypothetical protein